MVINIKERLTGLIGSISGIGSVLGSWQVCHNICLGIIFLLSLVGITVAGMPLLFLTKVAVPLWITAFLLLIFTLFIYLKRKCISKNMLIINFGFVTAGVPFKFAENFKIYFWIAGGALVGYSIFLYIKNRRKK